MSDSDVSQRELYTIQEVADRCRVSYLTIWRMIQIGDIKTIRLGRAYRIPATEVERLMTPGAPPAHN